MKEKISGLREGWKPGKCHEKDEKTFQQVKLFTWVFAVPVKAPGTVPG